MIVLATESYQHPDNQEQNFNIYDNMKFRDCLL